MITFLHELSPGPQHRTNLEAVAWDTGTNILLAIVSVKHVLIAINTTCW